MMKTVHRQRPTLQGQGQGLVPTCNDVVSYTSETFGAVTSPPPYAPSETHQALETYIRYIQDHNF